MESETHLYIICSSIKLQITSSNFSKIQFNLVTFEILIVVSIKFRQTVLLDVLKMMSFKKLKKKNQNYIVLGHVIGNHPNKRTTLKTNGYYRSELNKSKVIILN